MFLAWKAAGGCENKKKGVDWSVTSIHLTSGLPRSGSTLLAGIPRHNSRLHANTSSPVSLLLDTVL
jgi:hypothetical protein